MIEERFRRCGVIGRWLEELPTEATDEDVRDAIEAIEAHG